MIESANKQINKIQTIDKTFKFRNETYESGWIVNWFIDACHSGSCKVATEEWLVNEMNCSLKYYDKGYKIKHEERTGGLVNLINNNISKC